jgi:hypothetical protein
MSALYSTKTLNLIFDWWFIVSSTFHKRVVPYEHIILIPIHPVFPVIFN